MPEHKGKIISFQEVQERRVRPIATPQKSEEDINKDIQQAINVATAWLDLTDERRHSVKWSLFSEASTERRSRESSTCDYQDPYSLEMIYIIAYAKLEGEAKNIVKKEISKQIGRRDIPTSEQIQP